MGGKKPRVRRVFTSEFKAEIVELCRRGDRSIPQVAADFDLVDSAVRRWVEQADVDEGIRSDRPTTVEKTDVAALWAENRRLRADNEILKRAMAFFARETR